MTTSGFLYRDILKYILPFGLFFGLFYPFTAFKTNDLNEILPIIILFSFVFGILIEKISTYPFLIFADIRHMKMTNRWMIDNWNIKKLFYNLDNNDRDYLFLTAAYISFSYNVGMIILLYFLTTLILFIKDIAFYGQSICTHQIPFIYNTEINSLLVLILSIIIIQSLRKHIVKETSSLIFPNGEYEYFGEKLQKEKHQLFANKIYGVVYTKGDKGSSKPAAGIEIELIFHDFNIKTHSDCFGYWSVSIEENMKDKSIRIDFPSHTGVLGNRKINLGEYDKTYFENTIEN